MQETLKLILNKLDKLDVIKKDIQGFKGEFQGFKQEINCRLERIEKKIDDNMNLLLSEDNSIFGSLDKRISAIETRV